jgi:hypothetical protein
LIIADENLSNSHHHPHKLFHFQQILKLHIAQNMERMMQMIFKPAALADSISLNTAPTKSIFVKDLVQHIDG